jgi:hypothetical protein
MLAHAPQVHLKGESPMSHHPRNYLWPISVFVVALALLSSAIPIPTLGTPAPQVKWSETGIEITLAPNGTATRTVTFTSSQNLNNLTLWAVPQIAPFVGIQPEVISFALAGQPQTISLSVAVPAGISEGTFEGTVHVSSGSRTIPQTLKITIHVRQQAEFTLFNNPGDPLLLRAHGTNGHVIDYFGTKDELGLATSLTAVSVLAPDGDTTRILLDPQARPRQIQTSNGVVFKITWLSQTNILITAIAADGSIQINVPVDLAAIATGTLVPRSSVAPATTGEPDKAPRAGTAIHATITQPKAGQISLTPQEASPHIPTLVATSSTSLVNVVRCNAPVNDADVSMLVIPQSAEAYTLPGMRTGLGQYTVSIPTEPAAGQSAEDICVSIAGALGTACDVLSTIPPGTEAFICASIAIAISALGTPAAGAAILTACGTGFTAMRIYCETLGYGGPLPGPPSLAELICSNISEVVDRFVGGDVFLSSGAFVPGEGFFGFDNGVTAPASGPFPNFTIDVGSSVEILSFTTTPVDPAPFQGYLAEALITCAPPNTVVTISIVGTDGYTDSTSVTIQGDANVSLFVPGGAAGVIDTVTVQVSGGPTRQIVLVF